MLPQSDDRFDQELAGWFSQRGGAWSGTAGELLTSIRTQSNIGSSLWPQSASGLYAHLESRKQVLLSLGVDVLLRQGVPRMVSLRSCKTEQPPGKPPSNTFDIDHASDHPINLRSLVTGQRKNPADSGDAGPAANQVSTPDIPVAKPDFDGRFMNGKYADGDNFDGSLFVNTGEALFAIVEMGRRIREQGLDLESAVDLVVGRAQQITRACGIAVGFLPQETGYPFRTGIASSMKKLHFHANLFQASLTAGQAVQLRDAQAHPLLGAACQQEGIGSLIIVPIFRHREVAGAMEFLFQEKRSFSAGDAMDLGLIAGVISETLGGPPRIRVKEAEGHQRPPETKTGENVELLPVPAWKQKAGPAETPPSAVKDTIDVKTPLTESAAPEAMVLGSLASKLATAPTLLWRAFKRAWTGNPRKI